MHKLAVAPTKVFDTDELPTEQAPCYYDVDGSAEPGRWRAQGEYTSPST